MQQCSLIELSQKDPGVRFFIRFTEERIDINKSVYSHSLPRHLHCRTDCGLRRRMPTWPKLRFLWYVHLATGKWQTGTAQASFPANSATTNRGIDFNIDYTCLS